MEKYVLFSVTISELEEIIQKCVNKVCTPAPEKEQEEFVSRDEAIEQKLVPVRSYTTFIKYEKLGIIKGHRFGSRILYKKSELAEAFKKFKRA